MYNANNYGYNPYGTYMPQRPMPQPIQNVNETMPMQPINNSYKLNGKQVESIDVVRAMDIPMDGSISYFPIADGSAIVSKQLQMDGTSKTVVFKPIKDEIKEQPKYILQEDFEDLKDEINNLKQEIKDIKEKKVKDE